MGNCREEVRRVIRELERMYGDKRYGNDRCSVYNSPNNASKKIRDIHIEYGIIHPTQHYSMKIINSV